MKSPFVAITFGLLFTAAAHAEGLPEFIWNTTISGYVFGDAYAVVANHDEAIEGVNGFWIRRGYLTLDQKIAESFSGRLRFEMNSEGDFSSSSTIDPYVKDVWLRWKGSGHEVYLGMSPTPTFEVIERVWGYRHLEKTMDDLHAIGSSRDTGIAWKSKRGSLYWHAMLGNGSGTRNETNEGKKAMLAIGTQRGNGWLFEGYLDYEDRDGQADRTTAQGFAGWESDDGRFGLQVVRQNREVPDGDELNLDAASLFGSWAMNDRWSLIGRWDRWFDPNPEGSRIDYIPFDPTASFDFFLLGVELSVVKNISVTPNIEIVLYDDAADGSNPDDDLIVRVTLYYRF